MDPIEKLSAAKTALDEALALDDTDAMIAALVTGTEALCALAEELLADRQRAIGLMDRAVGIAREAIEAAEKATG
jgi:hypothetical protein